jgi:hypothetical protein
MEFTTEYIDSVQSVRRAAVAEAAHQTQKAIAETTKALATLRQAIDAYATVARNQTDHGAIAIAVEYAYRPLEKKLADLKHAPATTASVN